MKRCRNLVGLALLCGTAASADLEAGRAKAAAVCAACHGANGVSVSVIPNLTGQRAAYLADQLQAFEAGAHSAFLANVAATHVTLPSDFKTVYRRYLTKVSPDDGQAAKAGRPLPDGSAICIEVWSAKTGADSQPSVVDGNENWNYGVFSAHGKLRGEVDQAECLACHESMAGTSYLFLHDELAAAAKK